MTVQWQNVHLPLAAGIQTKADERALAAPALSVLKNGQFDETGGIQKRKPFASIGNTIVGGGTLSNVRRLASYGDELLAFTKDRIYSWSEADTGWVDRGEYLAPKVTERNIFTQTSEQVSCERAELGGVVFYAWLDTVGATTSVYSAAVDKATGATLKGPTLSFAGATRPRLLALQNKVMFFVVYAGDLIVRALDPTNIVLTGVWSTVKLGAAGFNERYDVAVLDATTAVVAMRSTPTTQYFVKTVTEDLASPIDRTNTSADCTNCISIDVDAGGTPGVARGSSSTIYGDTLDPSTMGIDATRTVGTSAATTVAQLTVAAKSTQDSGVCRFYVAWHSAETAAAAASFQSEYSWFTASANGTKATIAHRVAVASHAFSHDGRVFVWSTYGIQDMNEIASQNTHFLHDLTNGAFVVAKAVPQVGGGLATPQGHLPGIASIGGNSWATCLVERRAIVSDYGGYAQRSPRDVVVEFDCDEARRTVALGRALYVTGGQVSQYDGRDLSEVGFPIAPDLWSGTMSASGGSLEEGSYTWKMSMRWENARGEIERSTSLSARSSNVAAGGYATLSIRQPFPTNKTAASHTAAIEVWRTPKNPAADAASYLVTSKDPAQTGNNGYLELDPSSFAVSFVDDMVDSDLIQKETFPEDGGVLESIAPPPATIIASSQDRVFLSGISYDPHLIWYSKLRGADEMAQFNDGLTISVPSGRGDITALAFLNETLIAFCEHAIYALPGDGFDNTGGGQNYGPARLISSDVGATSADALAATPQGIVFHSSKGWFNLNRGLSVEYIGGPVADFDSDTWVSVHVLEKQHQIRCLSSSSRMLVFDYLVQQWAEWTVGDGVHSVLWGGRHVYATATDVKRQATDYTGVDYSLDVETAWIKLADLQGYQRVKHFAVLGEYRSAHRLRVRVARDYSSSWVDDANWTVSPTTVGGPEQVRHSPSVQKCQAIKIRLTDIDTVTSDPPSGEGLKLTGLALRVGIKQGLYGRLPAAQKQ